ncbi:MAG: alpha-amylase family glycosyl hydrolase [Gemmatimonadaceae bacterium]
MRSTRLLLLALAASVACRAPVASTAVPASTHAEWTRSAVIYEVNVRQFTPEGTFRALDRHLPRLDSLGVDILWLMPAQPIGVKNRKGPLGSYYAVSDYTRINPEFGTEADVRAFVDDAHRLGMRVILDWVPNHTAFDHPWITAHPDWYVHRADGSISNARDNEGHDTDWTDVAELNYDNADMRRAMIAAMKWWLVQMKIDGFRCDVAGGVPDDFWTEARRQLAAVRPDIFMLAESEAPTMHPAFDATYGWELHHLLNQISQGKQGTEALDAYLARQARTFPADAYRMYFTSNHDENSWNGTEFERMGANNQPSFVLAATLVNSLPLLYTGQEAGLAKRLRFFAKDTVDWAGPSYAAFYRSIFALKHAAPALRNGAAGGVEAKLATDGGSRIYAFTRTLGAGSVVVAVNFGAAPARVAYHALPMPGRYLDWFSRDSVDLAAAGVLEIPAHGYRVLVH